MLTVIKIILTTLGVAEVIFALLSVTIFPENRVIKFFRKHPLLQIIFWIILITAVLIS